MGNLVLSYVQEDRQQADALAAVLSLDGWQFLFLDHGIRSKRSLSPLGHDQLVSAICLIGVWSAHAAEHAGFLAIADQAHRQNKLLSVIVAPVVVAEPFASPQCNLIDWDGTADHDRIRPLRAYLRLASLNRQRDAARNARQLRGGSD